MANQEAKRYFKASGGFSVYGYRHNLRELRKKSREGVLGEQTAVECVTPYIYTELSWHTASVFHFVLSDSCL